MFDSKGLQRSAKQYGTYTSSLGHTRVQKRGRSSFLSWQGNFEALGRDPFHVRPIAHIIRPRIYEHLAAMQRR